MRRVTYLFLSQRLDPIILAFFRVTTMELGQQRRRFAFYGVFFTLVLSGLFLSAAEPSPISFNKHLAPVVFRHCTPCHRSSGSAPFALITYEDLRKRAKQIAEVTAKRTMPPWLPEEGYGEFIGERRLTREQVELFQQWLRDGTVEGNPADLPPTPTWSDDWQLGKPDLVLQMPTRYVLAADGRDLYRNFLVPNPLNETRFVRAVEFHPGNRSVHHVRILLDQAGQSRQLEHKDAEPGFDGMRPPAKFPAGHMITWVPGKMPAPEPDGLPWTLEKDTDLVLQIHLQRTGKPESLQPSLGLYFTNRPPSKPALVIGLLSEFIDIPAGESNYLVERSFKLPVDVEVLSVLPHLHYLGKEVQAFATLPGGEKRWLLLIKHWDFNWQGEYRYSKPLAFPKETVLTMRYTYDNSAENVRNPNHPPRRVTFGPQSMDEMGELWLQVLPKSRSDLAILQRERRLMDQRETAEFYEIFLRKHPNDAPSHVGLGKVLGPLGRTNEALVHFETALAANPRQPEAHYYLGLILLDRKRLAEARAHFEAELQVNAEFYKAHVAAAMVCVEEQNLDEAAAHLEAALRINPKDNGVQQTLANVQRARREVKAK